MAVSQEGFTEDYRECYATLSISREKSFAGAIATIIVNLDNVDIGVLRNGEALRFRIGEGRHCIRLRQNNCYCESEPFIFDIRNDETIDLICGIGVRCLFLHRTGDIDRTKKINDSKRKYFLIIAYISGGICILFGILALLGGGAFIVLICLIALPVCGLGIIFDMNKRRKS